MHEQNGCKILCKINQNFLSIRSRHPYIHKWRSRPFCCCCFLLLHGETLILLNLLSFSVCLFQNRFSYRLYFRTYVNPSIHPSIHLSMSPIHGLLLLFLIPHHYPHYAHHQDHERRQQQRHSSLHWLLHDIKQWLDVLPSTHCPKL